MADFIRLPARHHEAEWQEWSLHQQIAESLYGHDPELYPPPERVSITAERPRELQSPWPSQILVGCGPEFSGADVASALESELLVAKRVRQRFSDAHPVPEAVRRDRRQS